MFALMDLSGRAAMEELRKCEADLHAYGERNGLTLRLDPAYPGAPAPEDQPGPVKHCIWSLIGTMPGGLTGKLRHQATFGQVMGVNTQGHHTVFIGRLPETVGWVPMLSCRPDEVGSDLFAWAGDRRPRQKETFESIELDRRYVVEVAKGQEQVWLYRLFAPSLIDWLAHETPPDFGFRLSSGSFSCEVPQWRGQHRADGQVDSEHLDLVASCGGRVAGRIRDEVLEQVGLGGVPQPRSAEANRRWSRGKRHGFIVGSLLKLTGGDAEDDSARDFAAGYGLTESQDPAEFHSAHVLLPLPGAATDVFRGQIDGRSLSLAWLEYESEYYGLRYYVCLVADIDYSGREVWLDPDEVMAVDDRSTEGISPDALVLVRELGAGISTGAGSVAIYVGSTGWQGRPGAQRIGEMIDASGAILDLLGQGSEGHSPGRPL